jgi:DeoR/GlpR family transcriptional regulator of sugar metabolism
MIRSSKKSYVLADATKFGHASLARFARLEDIDLTITDAEVSPTFVDAFAKRELRLELAEVPRAGEKQGSIGSPVSDRTV